MSASLVGSEMCIRDRPQNVPPKAPEGCALRRVLRKCRICRRNGPAGEPCLLYTSDAADDM
eukprot:15102681-Alexandrium_andersonii.AAC.1